MLVQTKQRFLITLDQDEAEQFLDDPTQLQQRVREQLRTDRVPLNLPSHAAQRAP